MAEPSKNNPIEIIQRWLEADIIGKGICPPLRRLTLPHRNPDGTIRWDELTGTIGFQDLTRLDQDSLEVVNAASETFATFLRDIDKGVGPISRVVVLPDFRSNADYDVVMAQVQTNTVNSLLTDQGQLVALSLLDKATQQRQLGTDKFLEVVMQGPHAVADQLVRGAFRPSYFYGRKVQFADIADITDEESRGPKRRYQPLMRAPWPLYQVTNILAEHVISSYNPQPVYDRNTTLALATNLDDLEQRMRKYRGLE